MSSTAGTEERPWDPTFTVCNPASGEGESDCSGQIELHQTSANTFRLDSAIAYIGEYSHADGRPLDDDWRTVGPGFETDLASIPASMRWMVNSYGAHTPAALIHDKLIPGGSHTADVEADRYFRHMLADVDVAWATRWVMWAGVAIRTKAQNGRRHQAALAIWAICALIGLVLFVWALAVGSAVMAALSFLPAIPATMSWGGQWGVALIGVGALPFILPTVALIVIVRITGSVASRFVDPPTALSTRSNPRVVSA